MDSYSEQLVKQSLTGKQIALIVGTLVAAFGLWFVVFTFLPMAFFLVASASGVGIYWLASSQCSEMEYIVTNGDIDIDQITAKRSRKTVVRVRGKKIDHLLPCTQLPEEQFDRVVMAASKEENATWYFTYYSKKNGKTIVLFEPNEKTVAELRRGLNRTVLIETDAALRSMQSSIKEE